MKITIRLKENGNFLGEYEVRKNLKDKTILDKAKEYIEKNYNCSIRNSMITGKIDYATGNADISYVLFGENLPFRNFYLERG